MNKLILFLAFFTITVFTAAAQSFTISKPSITIFGAADDNVHFHDKINIQNNTSTNLTLRWVRKEVIVPAQWETSVCDSNECFPNDKDSGVFVIPANGFNYINIHFYPNNVRGSGSVKMLVYRISKPTERGEMLFTGTTDSTTIIDCPSGPSNPSLILYPNPATESLTVVANDFQINQNIIEVYDATGRRFNLPVTTKTTGFTNMDVSGLQKGLYFIRVYDTANLPFVKTFIKE